MLLLLSHGQATVERGFSVNKEVQSDNLCADTFTARRLICDHVSVAGGITNIDVTDKKLHLSASGARQRYQAYLDDQKKKAQEATQRKRKADSVELEELKRKQQCLTKDVEALLKAADEYAEKAEKQHDLTFVAKSNSLRRSAKDKEAELKLICEKLNVTSRQKIDQ